MRPEVGQVLHMDADEFQLQRLAFKLQREVSIAKLRLFFDVLFDAGLDVRGQDMRDGVLGRANDRIICL